MAGTPLKSKTEAKSKKSGIRTYKAGELMFNQNDPANSLFIIQKGQIRLFIPKGRGFVELAILRAGEVIGEMAYFDEKASRRSCSASAILQTDVIEISFQAFEKTMSGLNPWFKTIINTLADRLRKTNDKVKSLENNSVGFGAGGKVADYVFLHNVDVIRMIFTIYLVLKTHGELVGSAYQIHLKTLKYYLIDIFSTPEIKFEEFYQLLQNESYVEIAMDKDNQPKIVRFLDIESFRSMAVFLNQQKNVEDAKKLHISNKCGRFIKAIIDQLKGRELKDPEGQADLTEILDNFKLKKIDVTDEDLKEAVDAGLCSDIMVGEGNQLTTVAKFDQMKKTYPSIKMINAIKKINEEKAG